MPFKRGNSERNVVNMSSLSHQMLLVILPLLTVTVKADLHSATSDLYRLIEGENERFRSLFKYIEEEERRLEKLKRYRLYQFSLTGTYLDDVKKGVEAGKGHGANVINNFGVVSKVYRPWRQIEKYMRHNPAKDYLLEVEHSRLEGGVYFPKDEDVEGITAALFRLQDTYNLSSEDFADGLAMLPFPAEAMSASDCYNVAMYAYENRDWYHALPWLQTAYDRWTPDDEVTNSDIAGYLSLCLYEQGNPERALSLAKEATEADPDDEQLATNLEWLQDVVEVDGDELPPLINDRPDASELEQMRHEFETLCRGDVPEGSAFMPYDRTVSIPPKELGRLVYIFSLSNPDEKVGKITGSSFQSDISSSRELFPNGKVVRSDTERKRILRNSLRCSFKSDHPYLQIAPFKVEVVHLKPTVTIFHDVLSDKEIDHLVNISRENLQRAFTVRGHTQITTVVRTSKNHWIADKDDEIVNTISKRADLMTGLSMKTAEPLQVGNYGIGGHYVPHLDHIHANDFAIHGYHSFYTPENGNRIATILFYLSQPSAGGGTVFPRIGLSLEPIKNAAAFWFNVKQNGEGDDLTLHAGCPVLGGLKWVANKWIHERAQEFRRPCPLDFEDDY